MMIGQRTNSDKMKNWKKEVSRLKKALQKAQDKRDKAWLASCNNPDNQALVKEYSQCSDAIWNIEQDLSEAERNALRQDD